MSALQELKLNFWDTTKNKALPFKPIDKNNIRIYLCGPTVYDHIHIGNARPLVVFDLLYRLLQEVYGNNHITYVRNITDIDDKIINRAKEKNISVDSLTKELILAFKNVCSDISCLQPSHQPCATDYISEIINLITELMNKKNAYFVNHHVFFDVSSYQNYGSLSGRTFEENKNDNSLSYARIQHEEFKKNTEDFVLWKPSSNDEIGWKSPWGYGRPGWHIECSAMSSKLLGLPFDIHGGGNDLIFPHHENENAQSCAVSGCFTIANHWMHNGFVTLKDQKMSKSIGNIVSVNQVLKLHSGCALRLSLLQSYYRAPSIYTDDTLSSATRTLDGWYENIHDLMPLNPKDLKTSAKYWSKIEIKANYKILSLLADDLNTPECLAYLSYISERCKLSPKQDRQEWRKALRNSGNFLGLLNFSAKDWFEKHRVGKLYSQSPSKEKIQELIQNRSIARNSGNYKKADSLRDNLVQMGVALDDKKDFTKWRRELPENVILKFNQNHNEDIKS